MRKKIGSIGLLAVMSVSLFAMAQPAPKAGQNQGGGSASGGAGPMDPARFKLQILEGIKGQLAVSDDEWAKLSKKIEKVLDAQRQTRTGAGMSFSSPGMVNGKGQGGATMRVQGGGGANVTDTPAGKAMQQIRIAIDKETSDEEVQLKLAAMREARNQAREELAAAQKDLREACTARQEAVLVTLGTLE